MAKTNSHGDSAEEEGTNERYRWKAFGNLWFEDALLKSNIVSEGEAQFEETSSSMDCEEKKEDLGVLSTDGDDTATALSTSENTESFVATENAVEPRDNTHGAPVIIEEKQGCNKLEAVATDLPTFDSSAKRRSIHLALVLAITVVILIIYFISSKNHPYRYQADSGADVGAEYDGECSADDESEV